MEHRRVGRGRRRGRASLAVVAVVVLATGCAPDRSDGGEVVVTTDDRIEEVRAARDVLAAPVASLLAEAERLDGAMEELWTLDATSAERAATASSLRRAPMEEAIAGVRAVALTGDGPDIERAEAAVVDLVDAATSHLAAAVAEVEEIDAVAAFDEELEALLTRWDQRGSYSAQLQAFAALADEARALAEDAAARTPVLPCAGVWERRADAATVVADRTEELRLLVQNRRGQEFDELRDAYRQDPFGLGEDLGAADAGAAACWRSSSAVVTASRAIVDASEDLATALDPDDLRG